MSKHGDGHVAVRALVRRIRDETGRRVPDIDPRGPGTGAAVLLLLRSPNEGGSLKTGLMAFDNPDATARNERELLAEVGLPQSACTAWNAIPWDIQDERINQSHRRRGASYLNDLLRLFENPPVVVAHGQEAHRVCRLAGVAAIEIPMTSPLGLYGGGANRWSAAADGLRRAAEIVSGVRAR